MRLVAALGNGVFGRATRHSIGLRLLEELADAHGATWTWRFALFAHVARVSLDDDEEAVALVWPALPYNVIGYCVAAAAADPDGEGGAFRLELRGLRSTVGVAIIV